MGRTSEPLQASAGGGGHDDGIPEVAKSRTAVVKKKSQELLLQLQAHNLTIITIHYPYIMLISNWRYVYQ
jgi:hypothetical protein